jgi:hypothetical protein
LRDRACRPLADDGYPFPNAPRTDEAIGNVGIAASESLCPAGILARKQQLRFLGRLSVEPGDRAAEQQLAALRRRLRQCEVLGAESRRRSR